MAAIILSGVIVQEGVWQTSPGTNVPAAMACLGGFPREAKLCFETGADMHLWPGWASFRSGTRVLLVEGQQLSSSARTGERNQKSQASWEVAAVTSFYSGSASIVFVTAAAHAGTAPLHASGMLQALYTTSIPAVILAAANISEIWVDTLPTQVMPPTSVAARWKGAIEERNVLAWAGVTGMACCIPFGVATWFSLDTLKYVKAVNLATGVSAILAIICFNSVAINLTRIIKRVGKTTEPSDEDFYHRALKIMWAQVLALSATAVVWTMSLAILELSVVGQRTPVIFIALMVTDANVGFSLAVHFCKVNSASKRSPATTRSVV